MSSLLSSIVLHRTLLFTALLILSSLALAGSVQFQSTMTVRPGCSVMERPAGDPGMGYLCSPNVGDFRLTLDGGRNSDGVQRYLSDGQTRIPYRLQVFTGQGERLRANRVLSISLPEGVSSLMLQAFNTPVADMPPAEVGSPSDTVLATFEY